MRFTICALIPFLCLLLPNSVEAQAPDSLRSLQLGAGFGQYYSSVDFSFRNRQANVYRAFAGPQFGFGVRYFNTKIAGFIAELNYSSGGWSEELRQDGPGGEPIIGLYEREIGYAELQLITQFAFGRKLIRPFIQAGPYIGMPVSDRESLAPGLTLPTDDTYFGRPFPRRLNYGLIVGTGLYVQLGPIGLQAEGRVLAGVRDAYRPGTDDISVSRRLAYGWRLTAWYEW